MKRALVGCRLCFQGESAFAPPPCSPASWPLRRRGGDRFAGFLVARGTHRHSSSPTSRRDRSHLRRHSAHATAITETGRVCVADLFTRCSFREAWVDWSCRARFARRRAQREQVIRLPLSGRSHWEVAVAARWCGRVVLAVYAFSVGQIDLSVCVEVAC